MGISRLTGDLWPYLETRVLGSSLKALVIDGPALVFHVYYRLVAYKSPVSLNDLPSYKELNDATELFLSDVESTGAEIKQIYFDGGLPLSKRPVRKERLEKSRSGFAKYRLGKFYFDHSTFTPISDLQAALWHTNNNIVRELPTAALIVPSVLERLTTSAKWRERIQVVAGEADAACARAARDQGTAVLTNDSDLLAFEDMQNRVIARLQNIVKEVGPLGSIELKIETWDVFSIASKLKLPDLTQFAFFRERNTSSSTNEVLQMATTTNPDQKIRAELTEFRGQFASSHRTETAGEISSSASTSNNLDPRLSELVVQLLKKDEELEVYLPWLIEDPERVSSFTYGWKYRELAYYVLMNSLNYTPGTLTEYTLKTQSKRTISHGVAAYARTMVVESPFQLDTNPSTDENAILHYIVIALRTVLSERAVSSALGRHSLVSSYFNLQRKHTSANLTVQQKMNHEWELLHLHGNVLAVLYSLRMLKQALDYCKSNLSSPTLEKVRESLRSMPTIEALFLSLPELHQFLARFDSNLLRTRVHGLIEEPSDVQDTAPSGRSQRRGVDVSELKQAFNSKRINMPIRPEKKTIRKNNPRSSVHNGHDASGSSLKANSFAALSNDW